MKEAAKQIHATAATLTLILNNAKNRGHVHQNHTMMTRKDTRNSLYF